MSPHAPSSDGASSDARSSDVASSEVAEGSGASLAEPPAARVPEDRGEGHGEHHEDPGRAEDGAHAPFPSGPMAVTLLIAIALPLSARDGPVPSIETPWPSLTVVFGALLFLIAALAPSRRPGLVLHTGFGLALLAFPAGDDPNGRAGQLLLFLPLWLALFLSKDRQRLTRRAFGLLALVASIRLLFLGSRGGLLAALVAVGLVAFVRLERPRRMAFLATSALAALGIGLLLLRPTPATLPIDPIVSGSRIVDGEAEGLTVENLLGGRAAIWQSSLFALGDVPISGLGPGRFESVVPLFYPGSIHAPMPEVDDSHQFLIQVALDFGILGFLAIVWLLVIALGRLRALWKASSPGSRLRYWTAGLAASLFGFLIHGLVDTTSLTRPESWPFWTLLGSILGTRAPARYRWPRWSGRHPRALVLLAVAAPILVLTGGTWRADQANRQALWSLVGEEPSAIEAIEALDALDEPPPGSLWLRGLIAESTGHLEARDRAWTELLTLSPSRVSMVEARMVARRTEAGRRLALATVATEHWPESGAAWLFRARSHLELHPDAARSTVRLFRRGLELRPGDGHAWLELGDLFARLGEAEAALDAYAEACENGDPGANGCLRAGETAERLGRSEHARALYSRSRWPPIRERARAPSTP